MYRCHPAVPLAELMRLPVLLFFSAPPSIHTHKYLRSALQECSWRRRDVGLRPVLTWRDCGVSAVGVTVPLDGCVWDAFCILLDAGRRGRTMPAMCEGAACPWGHSSLLVVLALPGACVA
ncbi:hypothetical protein TcCL_NonESM07534 [Trypanosoma cruzi]|nr:hypothetical protein TcCL_NonESM07534 [Trypanosoma cruzi]